MRRKPPHREDEPKPGHVPSMKKIAVFCGSNSGSDPAYLQAAERLGALLASEGIGLVFGGGRVGLMGAVADGALAAGGVVVGVIPDALVRRELAHPSVRDMRVVASMHERKALMSELADGFIAMPGGYGTLDEFCEALTWAQLGIHGKPCGLLNIRGYFDPLIEWVRRGVAERFIPVEHGGLVLVETEALPLLRRMEANKPSTVEKWLQESQP